MNRSEVGNRIKELREYHNYTREELAERTEISSKFLYEIEKGRKGLSADTLLKIAKTLSSSCDYILTGQNNDGSQKYYANRLLLDLDDKEMKYIEKLLMLIKEIRSDTE